MTPVTVNAVAPGACTTMIPSGCWASLTNPGRFWFSWSVIEPNSSGCPRRKNPNTAKASAVAGKIEKKAK